MWDKKVWLKARYEKAKKDYATFISLYPFEIETLETEIWKWIKNYEGLYMESTFGRTKSFYKGKIKILKPQLNIHGYLTVHLFKNGKYKVHSVHTLVANTFIPNPDNLPEVNHYDGIKFNCHISNLERVTTLENIEHSISTGLRKTGIESSRAKFTKEQILEIRTTFISSDEEYGIRALARKYNVGRTTIKRIINREVYKSVE